VTGLARKLRNEGNPSEEPFMGKIRIISQKRVHGEVEYNDGEFAEVQTVGIEGLEKDLLLETIQVHRNDTSYTREQFQQKLPVGSWLGICTTIKVRRLENSPDSTRHQNLHPLYCSAHGLSLRLSSPHNISLGGQV
jgi:hypothetical protein